MSDYNKMSKAEEIQNNETRYTKVVRDGQVLIERDGKLFTITGNKIK